MTPKIIRRWLLPRGYEILPIPMIETLVDAAMRGYGPAFGGDENAVARAYHAGRAALNVLERNRTGGRKA